MQIPVDRGDDRVLGEWGMVNSVDIPDGMAPFLHIIVWNVEGIVEGGNHENEPGKSGEDLVSPNRLDWMGLASCEGVHC
jgi:hypothetical protein